MQRKHQELFSAPADINPDRDMVRPPVGLTIPLPMHVQVQHDIQKVPPEMYMSEQLRINKSGLGHMSSARETCSFYHHIYRRL